RIAGIVDQRKNFMARTQGFDAVVGKPAPASLREQASGHDGIWRGTDSEGQSVRGGYATSKGAGWLIFVSLPEDAIQAALLNTPWTLAALGALLVSAPL